MSDFTFYTPENSDETRRELLVDLQSQYGFIPNLFAYMAEAPTTIKAYLELTKLLGESSIPDAQLQVALLAVSQENDCNFCSVAHRAIGKKMGANPESLDAIANKQAISDPKDAAIAKLVVSMVKNRGWVPAEEIEEFLAAGYTRQQYLEAVLVVTIKTLSNYINHITEPEPNPELIAML